MSTTPIPKIRFMVMYGDGTSRILEFERKGRRALQYYMIDIKACHMAELVVSVDLTTGETRVLKNRYGDQGRVQRRLETINE